MDIIYRTGDLLSAPETIIVQACNAQGAMNSGVAKAIRQQYPEVFVRYSEAYERGFKMGQVVWVDVGDHIIGNAITQEFYGREPDHRYCSYDAIDVAFHEINQFARDAELDAVVMPLFSAGLAQGDWQIISRIIERACTDVHPIVYLLDGVIPS